MTTDQAKRFLPIIQAYAQGKQIQVRLLPSDEWEDAYPCEFKWPPEHYRIKPDPVVDALEAAREFVGLCAVTPRSSSVYDKIIAALAVAKGGKP